MAWELDNDRPIYLQIMERIERDIISGRYQAGEKLPSVRELAMEAAVNPNTMQKALQELERNGLVYAQRTSGRFITEDEALLKQTRKSIAEQQIEGFLNTMKQLGFTTKEVIDLLNEETVKEGQK